MIFGERPDGVNEPRESQVSSHSWVCLLSSAILSLPHSLLLYSVLHLSFRFFSFPFILRLFLSSSCPVRGILGCWRSRVAQCPSSPYGVFPPCRLVQLDPIPPCNSTYPRGVLSRLLPFDISSPSTFRRFSCRSTVTFFPSALPNVPNSYLERKVSIVYTNRLLPKTFYRQVNCRSALLFIYTLSAVSPVSSS